MQNAYAGTSVFVKAFIVNETLFLEQYINIVNIVNTVTLQSLLLICTVVPTKSDSYVVFCVQLLVKHKLIHST